MALRVAYFDAPEIGRGTASPDLFSLRQVVLTVTALTGFALTLGNMALESDIVTAAACAALLVFGLPHGSLDLALLRRADRTGPVRLAAIVLLYLGCAATMYAIWHMAPVAALTLFLVVACVHFAEDWADGVPPFFATGIAAAILTGPTLAHRDALAAIFVRLTGSEAATLVADIATLLAPVAFVTAGLGLLIMVRAGRRAQACEAGLVLAAMVVLPPVIGFALFFCLSHSPVQFAAANAELGGAQKLRHPGEVSLLMLAALGIAGAIYLASGGNSLGDGAVRASFITLSILTIPHMIMPLLLQTRSRRAAAFCKTRDSSCIE